MIFLGVAAFLLNVVLSRLVHLQRPQIAALKALGYPDRVIGFHYVKLVSVIVVIGAIVGIALGSWLGRAFTELYTQFFRFPLLVYRLNPEVVTVSVSVSLVAGLVGALGAARNVARMPPAEAMRPPAPPTFKPTLLERTGFHRLLSPSARMVLREIERRPLRLALSAVGVAMAVAILIVGRFNADALDHMMRVQFHEAWAEDVSVTFRQQIDDRALRDLAHVPGVLHVEGMRNVPVRFRNGPHFRDSVIIGYQDGGELRRPLDALGNEVLLPRDGIVLSRKLAEILDVRPGQTLALELREGDRDVRDILVADVIDDSFGLLGYMRLSSLQTFLGEEGVVNQALMRIDEESLAAIQSRLKELPVVQSVLRKQTIIDQFNEQSAEMMVAMTFIMTLFAMVVAVGVVYNNARVALSVRARDLGSLRVLGFSRAEISVILLGELGVQLVLAIPLGLVIGTWMVHGVMSTVDPEQYRLPIIISDQTYAFAAVVALAAGVASALLVRRKLDKLDLIAVLKTRE
jgi:putative ABC transport system permease protein